MNTDHSNRGLVPSSHNDRSQRYEDFLEDAQQRDKWRADLSKALGSDGFSRYESLRRDIPTEEILPLLNQMKKVMNDLLAKEGVREHLDTLYENSSHSISHLVVEARDVITAFSNLLDHEIFAFDEDAPGEGTDDDIVLIDAPSINHTISLDDDNSDSQLHHLNEESIKGVLDAYRAYNDSAEEVSGILQDITHPSVKVPEKIQMPMADLTTLITSLQKIFDNNLKKAITDKAHKKIESFCRTLLSVVDEFGNEENTLDYHFHWQDISHKLSDMFAGVLEHGYVSQRDSLFVLYLCSKYEQILGYMYEMYKVFNAIVKDPELLSLDKYKNYKDQYDTYSEPSVLAFENNNLRGMDDMVPYRYDKTCDNDLIELWLAINRDVEGRLKVFGNLYQSGGKNEKSIYNN